MRKKNAEKKSDNRGVNPPPPNPNDQYVLNPNGYPLNCSTYSSSDVQFALRNISNLCTVTKNDSPP